MVTEQITVTYEEALADYGSILSRCIEWGFEDEAEKMQWAMQAVLWLQKSERWLYCTHDCAMEIFNAIELDVVEIEEMLES